MLQTTILFQASQFHVENVLRSLNETETES